MSHHTIENVRKFWEDNPLWVGESSYENGSKDFFDEHYQTVITDCFAGQLDPKTMPPAHNKDIVLDLGCGPGFWTTELVKYGCKRVIAADLTQNALKLAKKRCEIYQLTSSVEFYEENAENLTFNDALFTHVNCQGVIHHTPQTETCVREIARVLKPNGTASISVYYRNIFIMAWPFLRWPAKLLTMLGGGLKGRGRESIFNVADRDEIVRLYDGINNPIGKSYTKKQFIKMLEPYFIVEETFLHFFPARTLPFHINLPIHQWLDNTCGFMIYANVRKPECLL